MNWEKLLYLLLAAVLIWFLYRFVKRNPSVFNRESIGKSFYTMGLLALVLIVFVGLCVMLLRA